MLKKCGLGLVFVGALMFGVCTVNTVLVDSVMATSHEKGKSVDIGQIVDIAQIPDVVRTAIEKETAGSTVKEIVKKEADGKVCYAVNCVKGGIEKTVKFTEAGAVVASDGKKADIAHPQSPEGSAGGFGGVESDGKKVDIAQVPAVVKAAIEKETAGGNIGEIVKKEADGKVCYAVEYVKDGMKKTLKLTEAGAVVASEDVNQPHTWDFPGKLTEKGDVVASDEKKADIAPPQSPEGSAGGFGVVASDGKRVDIAQVPAVVKATIEKETAGGTVKGIVKKEADGKVCYAVECVKDGMEKTLHIMYKVIDGGIYVEYIKDGMEKTVGFTEAGSVVAGKGKKGEIVQVPAVAKAAIEKETAGGTIKGIVKKEADSVVADKGEKVDIAQVTAVVKAAIEKEIAGGTIKEIVKKETDGKVCYAVKYVKDGMEKTAEFTEEGKRQ